MTNEIDKQLDNKEKMLRKKMKKKVEEKKYQDKITPIQQKFIENYTCLLYTSPSPRDRQKSRMPSSA